MSRDDAAFFSELRRREFPTLEVAYFNAAYMGPLPACAVSAVNTAVSASANPVFLDYRWVNYTEDARGAIARLAKCDAEKVSINSSTSEVVSTCAFGLDLRSGDRVAVVEGEYPSDVLPWLVLRDRVGIEVDFLPAKLLQDPKQFAAALHPSVRVVALSHVSFQTGSIVDLRAMGRELANRDLFTVVDVTQSFGGMPLDPAVFGHFDVVVCSTYKWLLAPYGQAFAVWSDRALARVATMHSGWLSMPQMPHDLTKYTTAARPGARRFDRGQSPNILGNRGLCATLELLNGVGLERIWKHNQTLVTRIRENLRPQRFTVLTDGLGSNILCLRATSSMDSAALQQTLRKSGIDVSVREGNLRISAHLWNSVEEVDRLLGVLEKS